jgi:hypothetical protein
MKAITAQFEQDVEAEKGAWPTILNNYQSGSAGAVDEGIASLKAVAKADNVEFRTRVGEWAADTAGSHVDQLSGQAAAFAAKLPPEWEKKNLEYESLTSIIEGLEGQIEADGETKAEAIDVLTTGPDGLEERQDNINEAFELYDDEVSGAIDDFGERSEEDLLETLDTLEDTKMDTEDALEAESRRAAAGRAELLAKKRHIDRLQNPAKLRRFRIGGRIRGGIIRDFRKMLHFGKIPKKFGQIWRKFSKILAKFAKFWKKTAKNSAIFNENFTIRERCKGVHCVDLGESFPTSICFQI